MSCLKDFEWYSSNVLMIQTKTRGLQPFKLRNYQKKYIEHLKNDFNGNIVRSIVLKSRQAGFSTLVAGINTHRMATEFSYRGLFMADKFARTQEVMSIYSTFVNNIPDRIKPMVAKNNSDEILFDNPSPEDRVNNPGLGSGFKSETAQDKQAGRSGTRMWAHLSEASFYPYAAEVDESVQNSIPLASGTSIIRESTANGRSGKGEAFYNLWQAAVAGESIYLPYFVSWFDIDDYSLPVPRGFLLTKEEIELVKRCPDITNANLVWRRLKLKEYSSGSESIYSPEERFCQDFPSYAEEAFLSTGRPVFDLDKLNVCIKNLRDTTPVMANARFSKTYLAMYQSSLKVFKTPEKGMKYIIGADVALGLEVGDFSTAFVMDSDGKQVASFWGKIDPDHFGKLLVELARSYNDALLVPEVNSMGHTTLNAIKECDYLKVYMRVVEDEIEDGRHTAKMGWVTTRSSKQKMLSKLISKFRDGDIRILDMGLLLEMSDLTRESDGDVELNGKDRVVAACLACVGVDQVYEPATVIVPGKKKKVIFEQTDKFRETLSD